MRPSLNAVLSAATADSGTRIRLVSLTLTIFVLLALLITGVLYLLFQAQATALRTSTLERERKAMELGQQRISIALDTVVSDVRFLAKQSVLHRWLASDDSQMRQVLLDEYVAFITEKSVYDHVSFYDLKKDQAILVQRQDSWQETRSVVLPEVVPAASLRDIFGEQNFEKLLALERNQIHVSPFRPKALPGRSPDSTEPTIVPVVGYGVAVYDQTGTKRGIVHLGYLAEQLLMRVKSLRDEGKIWVVDADGQWLLGQNQESAWTLASANGRVPSFAQTHAQAWAQIQTAPDSGQFMVDGNLYSYTRIASRADFFVLTSLSDTPFDIDIPPLFIVTQVTADEWADARLGVAQPLISLGVILLLLCAAISAVVAAQVLHRRKAAEVLKASEERFRAVLESAPDAVIISDTDGRIVLANAQVEKLFGYTRDHLIGQRVEMLIPERYRSVHVGHRTKYVEMPQPRAMGEDNALYGLRADGKEFPVAISLSPAQTAGGILVVSDIRDVTKQQETERRIKELNARLSHDNMELAAVNKELESFSYSVSHDLRAPLRAIDGFSQALQEDYADRLDDAGQNYLSRIRQAAQRMGQLIDDLLRLSKVTRANMDPEGVNLTSMTQDITAALQQDDPSRVTEFDVQSNVMGRGDSQLLRIALENLLGNAWKFTYGRSPARIEFGTTIQGGKTAYYVRDNGAGFDMAYVGQLFGAFRRLHDARLFPGTGIGLATVQRIIHRHGGRIWAEAAVDKGATFYFTLYDGSIKHGG